MIRPKSFLIFLLSLLLFAASTPASAQTEVSVIKDREYILLGMLKQDIYPYCYTNAKGEIDGLDIMLAKGIAHRMGVELRLVRTAQNHNELLEQVYNGKVDLAIAGRKILLNDARRVIFSTPYLTMQYAVFINRLNLAKLRKPGQSLSVLQESCARIGVLDQPHYIEYASKLFPKALIVPLPNMDKIVQMTLDGKLTAGFGDEVETKALFLADPSLAMRLKYTQIPEQKNDVGMITQWRYRHLRAWLNLYLLTNPVDLTVDKLLKQFPLP